MVRWISSTMPDMEVQDSFGARVSRMRAERYRKLRSVSRMFSTPGFWTLITTSSPVTNRAAWTWAIDADASATGSISE